MKLLDGNALAAIIEERITAAIAQLPKRHPGLAFVKIGEDPASANYLKIKKQRCHKVGIASFDVEMPASTPEDVVFSEIDRLNADPAIDGILVQLPLPPTLSPFKVIERISPLKDVDGFHPVNMGKLLLGEPGGFLPCTPYGIQVLLHHYKVDLSGKHVVIVGRSNIVGKPLAALLVQKGPNANATVTIAHTGTRDLAQICKSADVLVAACGKPRCITKEMVKKGAVVVDVGINRNDGKIIGDVAFDEVAPLTSAITPVPGGVGPMTVSMLLSNTLLSFERR